MPLIPYYPRCAYVTEKINKIQDVILNFKELKSRSDQ